MRPTRRLELGAAMLLGLAACQAEAPPRGLEATCAKACEVRAAAHCSVHQCRRGCNLVLDRLAQEEGDHVLACVTEARSGCDDGTWAHCATRIGPHADGGPPAPAPPPDVMQESGGD